MNRQGFVVYQEIFLVVHKLVMARCLW